MENTEHSEEKEPSKGSIYLGAFSFLIFFIILISIFIYLSVRIYEMYSSEIGTKSKEMSVRTPRKETGSKSAKRSKSNYSNNIQKIAVKIRQIKNIDYLNRVIDAIQKQDIYTQKEKDILVGVCLNRIQELKK